MAMSKKLLQYILCFGCLTAILSGCKVSYSLNGASIDYSRIKTIHIADFQNLAPNVYPPLAQKLSEDLKDRFQRQTRLVQTAQVGDLNIEGEIVGYDLTAEAVQADAYAAKTKLTMRVNIRYNNTIDEDESFEREFTSFATFDSSQMFTDVQDQLVEDLTKDLINQIFNATAENW